MGEDQLDTTLQAIQRQLRGPAPRDELVVMDGKEPRHGKGASILMPVSVPSQYYLGSAVVDFNTNEIPVAQRTVIPPLDLEGRFASLDALHTQGETARRVVLEAGGDYLLTVKKNQPTLRANIRKKVAAPRADSPLRGVRKTGASAPPPCRPKTSVYPWPCKPPGCGGRPKAAGTKKSP